MSGKMDGYRSRLKALSDWEPFLLEQSGLPGPRANLELAQAVAEEGSQEQFMRWISIGPDAASSNSPGVFLVVCGTIGMGRLIAGGQIGLLPILRQLASDPRWRVREGVAMALQRWGDKEMDALLAELNIWSQGNLLEQRAAAAALCEPRLLGHTGHARTVLHLLDSITASIPQVSQRKNDDFKVLRQGLAYCWSVAVAALPAEGKAYMEKWFASNDRDIIWIMRQNLQKNRLARMDHEWVERWLAQL
jgi:hypothetical protein